MGTCIVSCSPLKLVKWWLLLWGTLALATAVQQGVLGAVQLIATNMVTIAIFPLVIDALRENSIVREWALNAVAYTVNAVRHRLQNRCSLASISSYAQEARRLYLRMKQIETDQYYFGGGSGDLDLSDAQSSFMAAVDALVHAVNMQGLT
jgi:hypothetical protein